MFKRLKDRSLEERMMIVILLFSISLSIILVIENIVIDYPFVANYKWFACFSISLIFLYLIYKQKHVLLLQALFFIIFVFVLLPLGWFSAGVSNIFTLTYSFLILIAISFIFEKWLRIFLMISEVCIVLLMIFLNLEYPELFLVVPSDVYLLDSLMQVLITFSIGGLLLGTISTAYKKEKRMLKQYTLLLDEQNKELEALSMIDDLTQVYNRRYIFNHIKDFRLKPDPKKLILGMIDIDGFKEVNDTYGHELGDQVLKFISSELKNLVRNSGIIGRYGGDEFFVIFHNTDPKFYMPIIRKINHIRVHIDTIAIPVTLSGGFVVYDGNTPIDDALFRADSLLYQVKASGKNNMIVE